MHEAKAKFSTGSPVRISKALREELEAAIEAHFAAVEKLTAVLDKADGEADLEPSLGYSNHLCPGNDLEGHDVQDEPHDQVDQGDDEPSLSLTNDLNQVRALKHHSNGWNCLVTDAEAEHDGREPCCEDEGAQCEDEGADEHYFREGAL